MEDDLSPDVHSREILLREGLMRIPERLLLAQARGKVLFVCGAGVSKPAGLPLFGELVEMVYEKLDTARIRATHNSGKSRKHVQARLRWQAVQFIFGLAKFFQIT